MPQNFIWSDVTLRDLIGVENVISVYLGQRVTLTPERPDRKHVMTRSAVRVRFYFVDVFPSNSCTLLLLHAPAD